MTRTIADIMATELVTFHPNQDIHQAIHTLLEKRISGAPVVDNSGKLIGILSRKDCLRIAFSSRYHGDWGGLVQDYMVSEVKTLDASLDITAAVKLFLDASFRRFPVTRDGELVGLVSRHDILNALSKNQ
jgi:CBS domain-containing protein